MQRIKKGVPVDLIDVNREHVEAMNKNGVKVVGAMELVQKVTALTPDEMTGTYDLVFLLTKQTANHVALPNLLKHLGPDSIVCTLQNGVPEESVASYVGRERTIGGSVGPSCSILSPGVIKANSNQEIMDEYAFDIGELDGSLTPRLEAVAEVLGAAGKVIIMDNLIGIRWSKLMLNCSGAGLCACLGTTFGENVEDPKRLICLAFLSDELVRAAQGQGIKLVNMQGFDIADFRLKSPADIARVTPLLKKMWGRHKTSVGSIANDVNRGLKSEVDYINGVVSNKGRELGLPTPFNDMVIEIIKELEARGTPGSHDLISRFEPLIEKYAPGVKVEL